MPIFPEVESSKRRLPSSWFADRAARIILSAGRSLIEPPALNHSALANIFTPDDNLSRGRSGVLPTTVSSPELGGAIKRVFPSMTKAVITISPCCTDPDYSPIREFIYLKTIQVLCLLPLNSKRPTEIKKGQRNFACYAVNFSHAESQPPFLDCWPLISGGGGYEPRPIQMHLTKISP